MCYQVKSAGNLYQKIFCYSRKILAKKAVSQIAAEEHVAESEIMDTVEKIALINPALYLKVKEAMQHN